MEPAEYRSFLVRLWCEIDNDGTQRWCGEVEHIQSGRTRSFASLATLLLLLQPSPDRIPLDDETGSHSATLSDAE